jgi:hypothetical protein
MNNKLMTAVGAFVAAVLCGQAAQAEGLLGDRWQLVGAIGAEARVLDFETNELDDLLGTSFYGIGLNAGACYQATSVVGLCGEAVGFFSLGNASEMLAASDPSNIYSEDVNTDSKLSSFGVKVSAPISMGRLIVAPFVSAERINFESTVTTATLTEKDKDDAWVYSGGANLNFFVTENIGVQLQGQVGRGSFKDAGVSEDVTMYGARFGLAARF